MQEQKTESWYFKPTADDHEFLICRDDNGQDVALVRDFNERNAKLIAAAPDLLEALAGICDNEHANISDKRFSRAYEAIRKACH